MLYLPYLTESSFSNHIDVLVGFLSQEKMLESHFAFRLHFSYLHFLKAFTVYLLSIGGFVFLERLEFFR